MSELFDDADVPSEVRQDKVVEQILPFIMLPKLFLDNFGKQLGPLGITVYVGVKYYANYETKSAFILVHTLSKLLGMGASTIRRELSKLEELRLIEVERRFSRSSVFIVNDIRHVVAGHAPQYSGSSATIELHKEKSFKEKSLNTEASGSVGSELFLEALPKTSLEDEVVTRIWKFYQGKMQKPFCKLIDSRRRMILARYRECLKEGKTHEEAIDWMEVVVNELALSDFHNARGEHKGKKKFNDIEYAFRSWKQMERWLNESNGQ